MTNEELLLITQKILALRAENALPAFASDEPPLGDEPGGACNNSGRPAFTSAQSVYETLLQCDGWRACSYQDVLAGLRELTKGGWGRFLAGRHGKISRFEWGREPGEGQAVSASASAKRPTPIHLPAAADSNGSRLLEHRFILRRDLIVHLELPEDLTPSEAHRLALWIPTLPFAADEESQERLH